MKRRHVVIAGHCTIDDIHQANGQILPATPGGAAAYATLGAVLYGARVTLITRLGDDYPFDRFRNGLAGYGSVNTTGVRSMGPRSVHNQAWYQPDGIRHFDIESWDVMEALTPTADDLSPDLLEDALVLLTPGSLDKQLEMTRRVRSHGCPVIVDTETHYFPRPEQKEQLRAVIREASYFLPSIEHLQVLYGNSSNEIGSYREQLQTFECSWVLVKQGARGSTLINRTNGQSWRVPAVQDLTVRDVTGAGDGLSGGFTAALGDGRDSLDAACWGTVSASFVVESIGAVVPDHFSRDLALERYAAVRRGVEQIEAPKRMGGRSGPDS